MTRLHRYVATVLSIILLGCQDNGCLPSDASKALHSEMVSANFESLDLSGFGGNDWNRVCFFGPYNEMSDKVLGFSWHISDYTDVLRSDGHNVIVFANDNEVVEHVIHSRSMGDFWQLSGECFDRGDAVFVRGQDGDLVHGNSL